MLRGVQIRVLPEFSDERRFPVECVDMDKGPEGDYNKVIGAALGCEWYERIVCQKPPMAPPPEMWWVLLVDEEGKRKERPLNEMASTLVQNWIVGDVVLVLECQAEEGADWTSVDRVYYERVVQKLRKEVLFVWGHDLPF